MPEETVLPDSPAHAAPRRSVSVPPPPARPRSFPIALFLLLAMTATISLLWSQHKFIWQDEIYVLQTDSVPSLAQLVHIQLTSPISLDPLVYHAIAHAAIRAFGAGALAIRLPSLLGYLLMQLCLFVFVRRIAGERAGLVAAALPALAEVLSYSAEGRPYGLMLGLFALTMVAWQAAARCVGHRTAWLVTLALALAATINTHYFGILLLAPVCAAELVRTMRSRRFDWPMFAAIAFGMVSVAATVPFQHAAAAYRAHYYNLGALPAGVIANAYRALFVDDRHSARSVHAFTVLFIAALAFAAYRVWRQRSADLPAEEFVFLLVLAVLPVVAYVLALVATHALEFRFVLGTLIGVCALFAIAAAPALRRDRTYTITMLVLCLAAMALGAIRVRHADQVKRAFLADNTVSDSLRAAMLQCPDHHVYIQYFGRFEELSFHDHDPWVSQQTTIVYSPEQEMRWLHHDTTSITERNLQEFHPVPTISFESLAAQPGEHLFVIYDVEWSWLTQALVQSGAVTHPLGTAFGGRLVSVRFPALAASH